MKCCEYTPRGRIHNSLFSSSLKNGQNKLKCYIKLGWKGLPGTYALMYRACLEVKKKMKCCELFILFVTNGWAHWAVGLYYISLERLATDQHSNLLAPFISYEENKKLWILFMGLYLQNRGWFHNTSLSS